MAHPLDEYPIHQVPASMAYVGTSDRDFYDRNIFQLVPQEDTDPVLLAGFGVYPNLGVKDAYACVRVGDTQHAVRCSDELDTDRMRMQVGPIRIEVIEPLQRVRLICEASGGDPDGNEGGPVAMDLTWTASVPVHDEPHHSLIIAGKPILDASRFVGIGRWEGTLSAGGQEWRIDPATNTGTRDRSWGIRPSGEAVPPGRSATVEPSLYWFWVPLRFHDFGVMVIIQEDAEGFRTLNDAARIWPSASGGRPQVEQLGWPRVDVDYRPGSRYPTHATIHLTERDGSPLAIDIEPQSGIALNVGCGYPGDPDWNHGMWMGPDWVDRSTYDLNDEAVQARLPFTLIDHAARATCGDAVGYGIFEHGSIGRHIPSGFTDFFSLA